MDILYDIYRNYVEEEWWVKPTNMVEAQLHKDSLAFHLLRIHGYNVSPSCMSSFAINYFTPNLKF